MRESNTLAVIVANNLLKREFLLNTKESYTLAGIVANNSLKKKLLINTKGQYMKDLNNPVGNAANNFL